MKLKYLFFAITLFCLTFSACKKVDELENIDAPEYNGEFAIPLFSTSASLQDLLENLDSTTVVEVGPDDLITVRYRGNVVERTSQDFFPFLNIAGIPLEDSITNFALDLPGQLDLDYTIFKQGKLAPVVISKYKELTEITIFSLTIPQLTKDGSPFEWGANVLPLEIPASETFDISGYRLDTDNDSLLLKYEARLPNGDPVPPDSLVVTVLLSDLEYSYVEGYWGNEYNDNPRDTIHIDLFDAWTKGDVFFEDPKVNIYVNNSMGIPLQSVMNILRVESVDGQFLDVTSPHIGSGIDFDYPELNEVGVTKTTVFSFDKSNSNIIDVVDAKPVALDYDLDAITNANNDTNLTIFLTDSSFFNVQVEAEMSIHGSTSNFSIQDTFAFDINESTSVESAEFKLITENEIPIGIDLQIYFVDHDRQIIDSLLTGDDQVLAAAPADAEGNATSITEKVTYIPISGERLDKILTAKDILVTASFNTYNYDTQSVKILASQNVDIRMGVKLKL